MLNLSAHGNPEPVSYKWSHQGKRLNKAGTVAAINENRRRSKNNKNSIGGARAGAVQESLSLGAAGRPRISVEGPILKVYNVTMRDAGDYELEATNALGATVAEIYFNVQCKLLLTV